MKTINELFQLMMEKRCSHIHLVPGSPIMIRIQGRLSPLDSEKLTPSDTAKIANALLTDKQKKLFEERLEVDFSYSIPGLSRFRLNVFRQRGSIAMVIATHPPAPPTMEELGLPEVVKKVVNTTTTGLLLICGSRSSGKSHTLAAILNHILETRNNQIMTFENPIRFLLKNKKGIICQREKVTDFVTFTNAFDSLRHQSSDILVVTEIENYDVIRQILYMASSGTLVICTAQASSVLGALDNIIDSFPPHLRKQGLSMLSSALNAAVGQTLMNKATGGGMLPAFEILINVPAVQTYFLNDKLNQINNFMGTHGKEYGMSTQEHALRQMVKKNLVTKEEAISKAVRMEEFKKLISMPY